MSLQLQAAAPLWPSTSGVSGNLSALQQTAGDRAENGNDLAGEFAAVIQQSQAVQQQLQSVPAESDQSETGQTSAAGAGHSNQKVAGAGATSGNSSEQNDPNHEPNSEQAQKFLDGLMEQLLANRLGINKKEMDRLKEKIAELELKRKELADQMNKGGNDQNLGSAIRQIDQQITALEKQLQQLVRENELAKNNPDDDNRRQWSAQSLGQTI
jgi:chromosome segregation ATPase